MEAADDLWGDRCDDLPCRFNNCLLRARTFLKKPFTFEKVSSMGFMSVE
jgi:hypothetical protein